MTKKKLYLFFAMSSLVFVFGLLGLASALDLENEQGIPHKDKMVSPATVKLDDHGKIYMAWFEEEKEVHSLYLSTSADGGKSFSPKVKINGVTEEPDSIHQSPSLGLGSNGEVYVVWKSKQPGGGFSSNLNFSRSLDGGKSFSSSVVINDNPTPGFAGFESIAAGSNGAIYVAWIDKRGKNPKDPPSAYFARSLDGGKSFEKNLKIDAGACICCRTALAVGPDGTIYAAWRKAFEGNIKEIAVASSADGGETFSPPSIVGNDQWEFAGCPHRGPSLGVNAEGRVFITWYSEGNGLPGIYFGESADRGKTFRKEVIKVQPGFFPDHSTLTVSENGILLAWEEVTPVLSKIILEYRSSGEQPERFQVNQGNRKALYPAISANRKGDFLVSWTKAEIKFNRSLLRSGKLNKVKR